MEVTFRNTEADMQALWRRYPWVRRWEPLLWVLGFGLFGMSLASVLPVLWGFGKIVLLLWLAIGVIAVVMLITATMKPLAFDFSQARRITLRLEEAYWSTSSDVAHWRNDWSTVLEIHETDQHLFLTVGMFNAVVVPKSAFASSSAAEAFANFARRNTADASPPPGGDRPRWPLQEPELGDAPDMIQVTFRPQMQQLLEYDFHGLNPPQPNRVQWWALGLISIPLMGFILTSDKHSAQIITCLTFVLVSVVLTTQAYGLFRRWQWRRRCPPQRLQSMTCTFLGRGVQQHSATSEGFVHWHAYEQIRLTEKYAVLHGRPLAADSIVIPREAFARPEQATALVSLVNEHLKPMSDDDATTTDVKMPIETGNPYQPPLE